MRPEAVARPDLSRLPPFGGSPNAAGAGATTPDGSLDEAIRYIDPFHRNPQDALAPAIGAVVGAPSSAPARYILACALSVNGLHDDAHAVLEALRAVKDCPSCTDALLNAPDVMCDFEPRDAALAKGLKPSPIRAATRAVLGSLISGDVAAATPYLDASRAAEFSFAGLECETECTQTERYTRAQIIQLIRGAAHREEEGESYQGPMWLFCDNDCCRGPNPSHSHARVVHVDEVCFRNGPRPLLRSVSAGVDG